MIMMAGYNGFDDSTTMVIEQRFDKALLIDELRYEQLHLPLPPGWREDTVQPDSIWLRAIRHCYDQITWYCLSLASHAADRYLDRLHPEHNVYGFLYPLNAKGDIYENKGIWLHSGRDLVLERKPNGWEGGYCAERKVLERLQGRKVGISRQPQGRWGPNPNESIITEFQREMLTDAEGIAAWLLYTTYSPCKYCGETISRQLTEKVYNHIVVAFENCYVREGQSELPPDSFFEKVVYDPSKEGIEVFKIYRRPEDLPKLPKGTCLVMEGEAKTLRNPFTDFDPTLRVMRVTKV